MQAEVFSIILKHYFGAVMTS